MSSIGYLTTRDDVRIAYERIGAGPVVVFVRGWITHLQLMWAEAEFRSFMERIAGVATLVRYDGRGNGLADRRVRAPTLDDLVIDLETVMDELDISGATIWGSSYGGPIATTYVVRHPDRVARLILEGTFAWLPATQTESDRNTRRTVDDLLGTAPEVAATAISYMTDPAPSTRHEQRAKRILASVEPSMLRDLYRLAAHVDVRGLLGSIAAPTWVFHRRYSRTFPIDGARAMAAAIPGAQFAILEGSEHNPWEGDADEAIELFTMALGTPVSTPVSMGGVVTVMMTDIVDSSGILERLGDASADALREEHDRLLQTAISQHGGRSIKSMGDGMLAYFERASQALAASVAIQRAVRDRNSSAEVPIGVRIGLTAGEPISVGLDIFGTVVHLAARVCAMAAGGETWVTDTVRGLAVGKGFAFMDRGERVIRGFTVPVRLYSIAMVN